MTALLCGALFLGISLGSRAADATPIAEKKPMVDEYQGVKVTDDYQWLENPSDPAVKTWVAAENKVTREYLDALPDRAAIAQELTAMFDKVSPRYFDLTSRPGELFALKFQPPKQQPILVHLPSADAPDSARVILDSNDLEPKGKVTIDWYVPSPKGRLVAVSLSESGSEDGTLYFYDVDTGKRLPDIIPRVQYPTGGGSAAWVGGDGVFYTRYPHAGERPEADANFYQQVYFHKIGTDPKDDTYALGKNFPRIAEIVLESSRDDGYIVATVANGDGGEFAHYLYGFRLPPTDWHQLTRFEDKVKTVRASEDALYLLSTKDAPHGEIWRQKLDADSNGEITVSPRTMCVPTEPEATIEGMTLTAKSLFVTDLVGGPSRIRRFPLQGGKGTELPLPPISSVGQVVALDDDKGGILLSLTSYTTPQAWLSDTEQQTTAPLLGDVPVSSLSRGPLKKTALASTSPVDFSDIEAVREFATSKDGTRVPLNILKRKGTKLDGNNPTLLYGYGGYNISMTPSFDFTRRLWFDRGGVYVVANLRGGGEFGEEWHQGGNLLNKQNVFDDFAAAAEYLIKIGYTNPQKLAVEGGSNGGLLMGAFLTQHPDLARAVVSHVGIYDMLRVEIDPNGAFNVTEFGSVQDPAQFKALYAYSPYHHVVDGTKYPAILFMTGDNDGRVNPLHSRKMIARLQASNASGHPILLRTTANAGHGMGTALSERITQYADGLAFLFDQLGMNSHPSTSDDKTPR